MAASVFAALIIILAFTAGTALMMWMGEQINQKGIGNGISILLFAGIVARLPYYRQACWQNSSISPLQNPSTSSASTYVFVPLFVVLFLAVIWVIVFMNDSERRIPVQYAKRVVGRKMYGGQSQPYPDQGCACPALCRSSSQARILSIPSTIQMFMGSAMSTGFWEGILQCILLHRLALLRSVFPPDHHVRVFLSYHSV